MSKAEFKIVLKHVRLSFPNVFVPKAYPTEPGETPKPAKYGAVFLLDPRDNGNSQGIKDLESLIQACKEDKWPKKVPKGVKVCLYDGNDKETDGYEGMMYVSSSNKDKPLVLSRDKTVELTEEHNVIYAGCYVDAIITLWAQDHKTYGKRINANLKAIRFVEKGESFSAPKVDVDEFDDLDDAEDDAGILD